MAEEPKREGSDEHHDGGSAGFAPPAEADSGAEEQRTVRAAESPAPAPALAGEMEPPGFAAVPPEAERPPFSDAAPPLGGSGPGYESAGPAAASISPAEADRRAAEQAGAFSKRPELFVGGAFAGAFAVAKLLKRLGEGDR